MCSQYNLALCYFLEFLSTNHMASLLTMPQVMLPQGLCTCLSLPGKLLSLSPHIPTPPRYLQSTFPDFLLRNITFSLGSVLSTLFKIKKSLPSFPCLPLHSLFPRTRTQVQSGCLRGDSRKQGVKEQGD